MNTLKHERQITVGDAFKTAEDFMDNPASYKQYLLDECNPKTVKEMRIVIHLDKSCTWKLKTILSQMKKEAPLQVLLLEMFSNGVDGALKETLFSCMKHITRGGGK